MQTPYSDATYFAVIAATGSGIGVALLLGLDPGTAGALLGLVALASAQTGHIAGTPGIVLLPSLPEDVAATLPVGDDPSPEADVFGFDLDLSF